MKQTINHSTLFEKRESLKRMSLGMLGFGSLINSGPLLAETGFSTQGLKRIAPSMNIFNITLHCL